MVLRIKEREEAIQLLAMDPQVCGKLLTLHRKGNRVDVEALHDRIPLRQGSGKGPQMGSHGYRRLRRRKSVFVDASGGLGIHGNIQAKEITGGPQRVGSAPYPPGRTLRPCGRFVAPLTSSPSLLVVFQSKKNHREGFIPFGLRLVFLFCETRKQGKNRNWHWALG